MASLLSVNLGRPAPLPGQAALSGIDKQPQPAPILIDTLGLAGDAVLDRKHHGGPDQAVYLYFEDDYAWWSAELGTPIRPGTFGDNLTIAGVSGSEVAVGDRFAIEDVLLEVTGHRTPCNTLARQMGDPRFVKRFHKAGRTGAYCRVLSPGWVRAGAPVEYRSFAGERMPVNELMSLDGVREIPAPTLRRALATPIHHKIRADFEARLSRSAS